jgi:hypothetical protein
VTESVSPALRAHLDALAARASTKGANVWYVLNAAGLLFTEDRRRMERAHTLRQTVEWLEGVSVPVLIGAGYREGSFTALDMRRGITELLKERAALAKEGKA